MLNLEPLEEKIWANQLLGLVQNPRYRDILQSYCVAGTYAEVAKDLGLSNARVNQIVKQSLRRIRTRLGVETKAEKEKRLAMEETMRRYHAELQEKQAAEDARIANLKPRIDDWFVVKLDDEDRVIGRMSDHPKQHKFRSQTQITSPIKRLDREAGVCETNNRVYILGTESSRYEHEYNKAVENAKNRRLGRRKRI